MTETDSTAIELAVNAIHNHMMGVIPESARPKLHNASDAYRAEIYGIAVAVLGGLSPLLNGGVSIETVSVRDPDGPTEVRVFVNGSEVDGVTDYSVDAGAGYQWSNWVEHRDECLGTASSTEVREAVIAAFDDPPGGEYVTGREDGDGQVRAWLEGVA